MLYLFKLLVPRTYRREDQSVWERRAPLAPQHVCKLVKKGIKVIVQPSNRRAYPAQSYQQVKIM